MGEKKVTRDTLRCWISVRADSKYPHRDWVLRKLDDCREALKEIHGVTISKEETHLVSRNSENPEMMAELFYREITFPVTAYGMVKTTVELSPYVRLWDHEPDFRPPMEPGIRKPWRRP